MTRDREPHHRELKGLVVKGLGWTMASQGATQVLALLTSIIVARELGPREVGLAAMALVFGSLALVLLEFGFGAALIQRPELTEEDKSTAFWSSIALGVVLTLGGVALSWPIANLYGEPEVQPLFAVLSLLFLVSAPSIVQGALLMRNLEFRSLQLRTVAAVAVSSATAIVLALLGAGAWAIIAQTLANALVSVALLWTASPWRPRAIFSMASLKGMAGYSSQVGGARGLYWATLNIDNFLIGRFLGPSALGPYAIAFSVMITPVNRIAIPVREVFFPAFSRMRDPEMIAGAWMRAVRMVALVVVPVTLGLIAVAPDFVEALFGDAWDDAVPVIQILAPVGLIAALVTLNEGVLESLGLASTLFRFTIVLSIATVAGFAIGLEWGIEGVAAAYLIVTLVLQPVFVRLAARAVGLTIWDWLRSIVGVLQAGVGMLAVVLATRELLLQADLSAGLRLAVLVVVGALAYLPLVAWRAPEVRTELRALRERRRQGPAETPPEGPEAPASHRGSAR